MQATLTFEALAIREPMIGDKEVYMTIRVGHEKTQEVTVIAHGEAYVEAFKKHEVHENDYLTITSCVELDEQTKQIKEPLHAINIAFDTVTGTDSENH